MLFTKKFFKNEVEIIHFILENSETKLSEFSNVKTIRCRESFHEYNTLMFILDNGDYKWRIEIEYDIKPHLFYNIDYYTEFSNIDINNIIKCIRDENLNKLLE